MLAGALKFYGIPARVMEFIMPQVYGQEMSANAVSHVEVVRDYHEAREDLVKMWLDRYCYLEVGTYYEWRDEERNCGYSIAYREKMKRWSKACA